MQLETPAEPITATDDEIRAAVAQADPVPLLASVAFITGDMSLLRDDLRPNTEMILDPLAGLTEEKMAEMRELAVAALAQYRDAGCPAPEHPSEDALRTMITYVVGEGAADTSGYYDVLYEELALEGSDTRKPSWTKADIAPDSDFRVAIVGAGMSGLCAAHRLDQAGIEYVIFEKNRDVGGTWFENVYPGCRVDVPNHLYSYSFAQTNHWPHFFSAQPTLLEYFQACADALDIRKNIRFSTEVVTADWDEADGAWHVLVRNPDGSEETVTYNAIISAVGQLNRPRWPDIEGRDDFAGDYFHSAEWDHSIDLNGKRVIVIGTGASAAQFIPTVADQASELVIFQRTAPWFAPSPNYHDEVPEGLRWVLTHVPSYARWDRLWLFWRSHEGLLPMATVDESWDQGERSVSMQNDMIREFLTMAIRMDFPEDELFNKVVPNYPPIAKRIVRDNGIWSRTLHRDHVQLITDRIDRITEKGVKAVDGTEYVCDVLIYGTGFTASSFLTPMKLRGTEGRDLHETWDGDARAYLGITVPHFPNLYLMYGPNTNIVINGSITYFSECETHYILESIKMLLQRGVKSMDCKPDVHDAYNVRIDDANRKMAWGASKVSAWYKNAKGRVTQNWPFSLLEYWQQTREPDPEDYVLR